MKKLTFLFTFAAILIASTLNAQTTERRYLNYNWEENPKLTNTDLDTSNNSIVIFSKNYNEYVYENSVLCEYKTTHKRVKLITHVGIESNNKVYIPLLEDDKAITEKARVIKNDGTIRELKKDEIKEGYEQESGTKFHYFAFEGIEIGCEIEYLYCIKRDPSLNGSIVTIQLGIPILHSEIKYITPGNLGFKFKSYNGCPDAVYDTTEKENNVWVINKDSIPRLKDEDGAALEANKMKYAFKLNSNSANGKKDIYAYGPVASDLYDGIYNKNESKDTKAINSLIKEMKLDANNEEAKIRLVENYLKTNFIYYESSEPDKSILLKVIANKAYNDFGAAMLFANVFKALDIEHELVLTSDRFETKFDKEFECYTYLSKYLIYFPKIKKYLSPADNFTRLGFPNTENINNYGLFIKTVSMGDYNTGLGKIKFIQGAKYDESLDILKINVDIPQDFTDTKLQITREMTGYQAANYQPFFDFIKEADKLKEFSESIIKYIDKEGTIENLTFENNKGNFLGQKPLIAKANIKSDYFFEKAGSKYLFKAGLLIGPQQELYKKEERKLPLEFPYSHGYIRNIAFNIPDGYKISNLDQLKINEVFVKDGKDTTMSFNSNYVVENNKVTISITEYYNEYGYPVSEFEEYRRVANASANFNKVVLVFEKK
ncbi:MAG: DUF3857 domain-containing protein [Bacteroidota bacterium]